MKEYKRDYPIFSLCGLNCGLCPRYHTDGASKCPGCGGVDFHLKHPSCRVINCNLKHDNVEFCFECSLFPCEKYIKPSDNDSFITYANVLKDFQKAKENGIENYIKELKEKTDFLNILLGKYNDGRRKNFYCLAINLLDLDDIKKIMKHSNITHEDLTSTKKDKVNYIVNLFREKGAERGIELKLRK